MSSDVKVGAVFDSKEKFQAALLLLTTSTSKDFRIAKNCNTQYLAVCYSNKTAKGWKKDPSTCQWFVNAKPFSKGSPDGKWIVSKFVSHHSCRSCDSKRKRNYNSKTISKACNVVSSFIPAKKGSGSTQQLMDMTKASRGIQLKDRKLIKLFRVKETKIDAQLHLVLTRRGFANLRCGRANHVTCPEYDRYL